MPDDEVQTENDVRPDRIEYTVGSFGAPRDFKINGIPLNKFTVQDISVTHSEGMAADVTLTLKAVEVVVHPERQIRKMRKR